MYIYKYIIIIIISMLFCRGDTWTKTVEDGHVSLLLYLITKDLASRALYGMVGGRCGVLSFGV